MTKRGPSPWLLGGLGAAALLLYTQRKTVMIYGAKVVSGASELVFKAVIPDRAGPYADIILRVSREKALDPFLIVALGERESGWGVYLSPPGPGGTGDNRHGRGLLQIDDRSHADWLAANDWTDPYTNVSKGAALLSQALAFFRTDVPVPGLTDGVTVTMSEKQASRRGVAPGGYVDPRPLAEEGALYDAAIAAYNTGVGNVLLNLAAGLPAEATTTGANYSSDVAKRAIAMATAYNAQVA